MPNCRIHQTMKNDRQVNMKHECTAAKFPLFKIQNQINTRLKLLSGSKRSTTTLKYTRMQWQHSYLVEKEGVRGEGRWTWQVVMVCVGGVWGRLKPGEETVRSWGEKRTIKLIKKQDEKLSSHKELHKHMVDKGRWIRKQAGNRDFREHVNRKWTGGANQSRRRTLTLGTDAGPTQSMHVREMWQVRFILLQVVQAVDVLYVNLELPEVFSEDAWTWM